VNCRPAEIGFCSLPGNGDFCRRCETIRRPGYSTDIAAGGRPFIIPIKFAGEEKALKICFGVNVVGAFLIWLIGKEAGRRRMPIIPVTINNSIKVKPLWSVIVARIFSVLGLFSPV